MGGCYEDKPESLVTIAHVSINFQFVKEVRVSSCVLKVIIHSCCSVPWTFVWSSVRIFWWWEGL